jgi:hypothetical protein
MPQRYTQEAMIAAIRRARGLKAPAARLLGCSRNTVQDYCDKFPRVAAVVQEERDAMTDLAEGALYTKVSEGEGWAVCFYLKTQAKDRGYVEHSTADITSGGKAIRFTLNIGGAGNDPDPDEA